MEHSLHNALETRAENIKKAAAQAVDLLVIGGGITGVGIALDAVCRGLSVILVEKDDYAYGTSSRSTKLIHGGLRYLKQFEFGLVREVGHERAIVHRNAPHLVHPGPMYLPVVKNGSMNKLAASIGIYVYDWLAGVKFSERRKMLNSKEAHLAEPLIREDILNGGALYTEYRTDDARLTAEIMKTAVLKGAMCFNYMRALKPVKNNGKISGCTVRDEISSLEYTFNARCVINAAGPWVDEIRKTDGSLSGKRLKLSKGVHLVFPHEKLPVRQACYVDVLQDKGRMIFCIPRGRTTYVGTTDTFFDNPDSPDVTQRDVSYLLDALNQIFNGIHLRTEDIESSWTGVRPLIYEEGKSASELSRKDEIFLSPDGLISIAGGKLTGYRKMAQRSVDEAFRLLGKQSPSCTTAEIKLTGSSFDSISELKSRLFSECGQIPVSTAQISDLVDTYGSEASVITEFAYDIFSSDRNHPNPLMEAEIKYVVQNEQVLTPSDYFIRRSAMLYFNRPAIDDIRADVEKWIQKYTGLDSLTFSTFSGRFTEEYNEVLNFKG